METSAILEEPLWVCIYPRPGNPPKPRLAQDRIRANCYGDVFAWMCEKGLKLALEGTEHYVLCVSRHEDRGWYHYSGDEDEFTQIGHPAQLHDLAKVIWRVLEYHSAFAPDEVIIT